MQFKIANGMAVWRYVVSDLEQLRVKEAFSRSKQAIRYGKRTQKCLTPLCPF